MKVFTQKFIASRFQAINVRSRATWLSCSLLVLIMFGSMFVQAQTSVQNFGAATFSQTSATGSTAVIPNPTSGTTWARGGATAPAAPINGLTTSNPLGTAGTYVRATASATGAVTKFSPWVGYTGGTEFYTSFKVLFGDVSAGATATSGVWKFYQGAGAMYSDASDFTGAQVFTGLTFTYGAGGALAITYRLGATNSNAGLSPNTLSSGTVYTIEIVGNNKVSGTTNYTYNGVSQSVAVQKFDLYVNGAKIGDDLGEAALPAGTNIASGTFIGISSTSNVANIFVDDAVTYNAIPATIGAAPPTVTTDATPSAIGTTTATLGGNVTADGGSLVTGRGVVYAETATNATPAIGGGGVTNLTSGGTTGAFSVSATSLSVNTQYSYRAYATNIAGTNYGGVSGTNFYTLANTPNAPDVTGATSSSLNVAVGAGDGNPSATGYAIQETTTTNYVQADGTLGASAVFQTAATWGTKTVTGLAPVTLYTFQVKARNGANTETSFGASANGTTLSAAAPVLNATAIADFGAVCISNTAGPNTFTITGSNLTTADVTVASLNGFSYSTDDLTYTSSLTIPQPGGAFSQQVYVKFNPTLVQPYGGNIVVGGGGASNINAAVTGSGINTAPSVTTGSAGSITQVSATLNGTITADGCTSVTAYGLEYSTLIGFANGTGTQAPSGNLSLGSFSSAISGLSANTIYYYHAYATNNGGTSYGSEQNFLTSGLDAPVAIAATDLAGTSFTANWNAVTGATSYRLDVSTSPTFTTTNATDLFISEYVEGSSNNKYVEIYNGTGASVSLADYKLQLYTNGSPTVSQDITLSGTLANGSTIVYKNASAAVYGGAATTNAAVNYNGDDAVALFKISTSGFVDILGSIGTDPGTAWTGAGGYSTLDKTLVRNANVGGGLTSNPGITFPTLTTEWSLFNQDDVSHLGAHTFSATNPSLLPSYNNLTVNGLSQSVTGLASNTTYYYRVRAVSTNSTSANSNTISATTLCIATVNASSGANGSVSPVGATDYACGDSPTYNIAPSDACYSIADVIVDGISVGAVASYTFTTITAGSHTISATFVQNTYTVTAGFTGNGTVSPAGASVVNCGDDLTYTITPGSCYSIGDVVVDGVSVGAVSTYTFDNVNTDHTIDVTFTQIPYTITVSFGPGGLITPATGTVNCGEDATYTITANGCSTIADVLVDGVSQGPIGSYTFTNVGANHTISATFTTTTYTITASSGPNGSVTPAGASVVNCGTDNTYTITPIACYHVDDVLVDGVSVGAVTSYTFTNTSDDHTISASFAINTALAAPVVTGIVNVCPYLNGTTQVVYTASSQGATGYTWVVPPTNVNIVSGQGTSTLTVTFQPGFSGQPNKQIRVTGLSSCGNSPQTIYYLAAQAPVAPAPINGITNVCDVIGTAGTITYTISSVPAATSYIWTAQALTTTINHPNGPGVNDTMVTVSFTNGFTSSQICVQAVNGCGTSGQRCLSLIKAAPATPGLISGPTNVCANIAPGGVAANYSVTSVPGMTYTWGVPAGAIGLTGQGTAFISFTYPAGFTSGSVTVTASNGCGPSAVRSLSVTKLNPSAPSAIDVQLLQDCPERIYSYSVSALPANATSIQWTVPAGATGFTGQGTTSIQVSYPATAVAGTVTATAVSNCGTSTTRTKSVNLAACPDGPPPPPPPPGPKVNPIAGTPAATMEVYAFPNPTVNDFTLKVITGGKELIHVRISDMQGRELKQFTVMPFQATSIGADLKAGSYVLEVRQGNAVKITKLFKF